SSLSICANGRFMKAELICNICPNPGQLLRSMWILCKQDFFSAIPRQIDCGIRCTVTEPPDSRFAGLDAIRHGIWRSRKLSRCNGKSREVVAQEQTHNVLYDFSLHMSPVFLPGQSRVRVLNDLVTRKIVHIFVLGRPFLGNGAEEGL